MGTIHAWPSLGLWSQGSDLAEGKGPEMKWLPAQPMATSALGNPVELPPNVWAPSRCQGSTHHHV